MRTFIPDILCIHFIHSFHSFIARMGQEHQPHQDHHHQSSSWGAGQHSHGIAARLIRGPGRAQGGCRGGAMDEIGIARDFSRCEYVPVSCARKLTAEGINAQLEPLDKDGRALGPIWLWMIPHSGAADRFREERKTVKSWRISSSSSRRGTILPSLIRMS